MFFGIRRMQLFPGAGFGSVMINTTKLIKPSSGVDQKCTQFWMMVARGRNEETQTEEMKGNSSKAAKTTEKTLDHIGRQEPNDKQCHAPHALSIYLYTSLMIHSVTQLKRAMKVDHVAIIY